MAMLFVYQQKEYRMLIFFYNFNQAEQVRDMERQLEFAKEEAANIQEIGNTLPTVCLKASDEHCLEDKC